MIYTNFQNDKLSLLGFGAMRLPLLADGSIDEPQVQQMVDYAMEHGVNYFDTAYPYHGSMSELVMGRTLKKYPRESFYLATKYPGHQIAETYNPAEIFEEQLEKCQVEYFDYYLLHNIYEKSLPVYLDPKWGIIDYFLEQKRQGRIKHLGFSTHGFLETMDEFLEKYGKEMEFCQIQLNYLDWTLQDAKGKCALLAKYGIPVWVMEPVRGGMLANLKAEDQAKLEAVKPGVSPASWALRFLQDLPDVKMILSGMSDFSQMVENVDTFAERKALTKEEKDLLFEIAEGMKNSVPCTACRYCVDGCPMQIDIPKMLSLYNDCLVKPNFNAGMLVDSYPEEQRPAACIGCGACSAACPQKIDIPACMEDFAGILGNMQHWDELCKNRAEAAKKAREAAKKGK
ncbi:MAG: aldo/keto reductase [Dorea sp.]|nr:aldo/keto reductase [Dorea sp.]